MTTSSHRAPRAPAQTLPPSQAAPSGGAHLVGQNGAPVVKVDTQWTCKAQALGANSEVLGDLPVTTTVGTPFLLSCEGPAIVMNPGELALELPKAQKYQLKLLASRKLTDSSAEFIATAWAAGDVKLQNPVLTDGTHRIGLGDIHYTIASVVDQKANPEGKPFGPWAPLFLPLPLWIWLGVLLIVVALITPLIIFFRRYLRKKSLSRTLAQNPIALTPYHHFNKELRRLARMIPNRREDWTRELSAEYVGELDENLRWFLSRELEISAFDRDTPGVLRELKRQHPKIFQAMRREFAVTLGEIQKAKQRTEAVSIEDVHQISELARRLADRLKDGEAK